MPPTDESLERPRREVRADMVDRLGGGGAYGYLAYVDDRVAGWANASPRSDYGMYRLVDPEVPDPASVIADRDTGGQDALQAPSPDQGGRPGGDRGG